MAWYVAFGYPHICQTAFNFIFNKVLLERVTFVTDNFGVVLIEVFISPPFLITVLIVGLGKFKKAPTSTWRPPAFNSHSTCSFISKKMFLLCNLDALASQNTCHYRGIQYFQSLPFLVATQKNVRKYQVQDHRSQHFINFKPIFEALKL